VTAEQLGDLEGEIARADWSGPLAVAVTGIVLGIVGFAVAIAVAYMIRHAPAPTGLGSALARVGLGRARAALGTADRQRWLCGRCRSWNEPAAGVCYRGCGPRDTVRMLLPGDVPRASAEAAASADDAAAADPGQDQRPPSA
jgi:hypothetical protein